MSQSQYYQKKTISADSFEELDNKVNEFLKNIPSANIFESFYRHICHKKVKEMYPRIGEEYETYTYEYYCFITYLVENNC